MILRPELSFRRMKRLIGIAGHKMSLSREAAFWHSLKDIAAHEGMPVSQLVNRIDTEREHANLSSSIRLFVLEHYRRLADEAAPGGKRKRAHD